MAGSYQHCVNDDGKLSHSVMLSGMLENGGDVYEAVEELYGMIWLLADRYAGSNTHDVFSDIRTLGDDVEITPAAVVEWAKDHYRDGLALSPGLAEEGEGGGE